MRRASYAARPPAETPNMVIAALGPKMLALARIAHQRRASPSGLVVAHPGGALWHQLRGGQRPSQVCYVTLTGPKDGATAAGGRSCCLV
jgi:hypothetical protein